MCAPLPAAAPPLLVVVTEEERNIMMERNSCDATGQEASMRVRVCVREVVCARWATAVYGVWSEGAVEQWRSGRVVLSVVCRARRGCAREVMRRAWQGASKAKTKASKRKTKGC